MYATFEPKGAAKGLPPVRDEKVRRWLGHLHEHTHSLLVFSDCAEEQVAGHAILAPDGSDRAELALFVHQDFRGHGVGFSLAQAAVQTARHLGLCRVWLTVSPDNKAALRVYEKCGFCATRGSGPHDQEMELRLD